MNATVPAPVRGGPDSRARRRRARAFLGVGSAVVAVTLAACGGGTSNSASTAPSGSASSASSSAILDKATTEVQQYYDIKIWDTPTTGPKAAPSKNVWWVSCGQQSPGCAQNAAAAVEAGKEIGWKVTVFDGNFGINDAYSTGVRQAVAAKADGIILLDIECGTVKQALVEAKNAGIPVLNIQGPDCPGSPDLQHGYQYFPEVPTTEQYSYLSGQIMGYKAIVDTNAKANLLYYHILGNKGSERVSAGIENVLNQCPDCSFKQIDVPLAQLAPTLAAKVQSDLLGNPDANAVAVPFASVFDVGLGAGLVRANKPIVVISASQSPSYYNSIRKDTGLKMSTLTLSSLQQSWGAIDDMNRLLSNGDVITQGGFIGLTDKTHNLPNGDEDFDGKTFAQFFTTKFPYRVDYAKVWKGQG